MTDMTPSPEVLLSEKEVRQILERAARLESGGGSLTVPELQRVALEAGFKSETISLAIKEILDARGIAQSAAQSLLTTPASAPVMPGNAPAGKFPRLKRLLTSALAGGATAFLTLVSRGPGFDPGGTIFALIVLAVATAFRAFHHRREGTQEDFQLEVAGIWAGFSAIWSLAWESRRSGNEDVLIFAMIWLISAIIGGLIVMFRRPQGAHAGEALPPVR